MKNEKKDGRKKSSTHTLIHTFIQRVMVFECSESDKWKKKKRAHINCMARPLHFCHRPNKRDPTQKEKNKRNKYLWCAVFHLAYKNVHMKGSRDWIKTEATTWHHKMSISYWYNVQFIYARWSFAHYDTKLMSMQLRRTPVTQSRKK